MSREPIPMDSAQRGEGPFIWRFNRFHRWTHAVVIVSFFLLAITGLPLRFSCAAWSGPLIRLLGGVEMAGWLHRLGAILTFGYFLGHLGYVVWAIVKADDRKALFWGPDSIIPQPKDVGDFFRQFKWYFGMGPRPKFGRYSYMEKFDYFAVFWGVAIIGGSGLLLWFPVFFAQFMPGWVFNVAAIVHADEALLATGFIFTFHFFHVHMRPDKFPLDAVMFTGRATLEYLEEEHELLGERLRENLDQPIARTPVVDAPAPPPTRRETLFAAFFGFIALGIGFALIGMILWAVSFCP